MESWLVFQHQAAVLITLGTQTGNRSVPNGHGASLLGERSGGSGVFGRRDWGEPELARKAEVGAVRLTVPQTDTGG